MEFMEGEDLSSLLYGVGWRISQNGRTPKPC